jgi:nickel transport protein
MKNKSFRYFLVLIFCFGLLQANNLFAHNLKIFAFQDGEEINGKAYFPGGAKAKDLQVLVLDQNNKKIAQTVTDQQGKFSYLPKQKGEYVFVVETLDGHKSSFTVNYEQSYQLSDEKTKQASTQQNLSKQNQRSLKEIENIISRQLAPLKQQIKQYEQTVRMRDVVGAIGYIFGIMGLWALVLKKEDKKK